MQRPIRLEGKRLRLRLFRTDDPLMPIASERFLTTYSNDDADASMDRTLKFRRADSGTTVGFLMHADPIRDIGFTRVVRDAAR